MYDQWQRLLIADSLYIYIKYIFFINGLLFLINQFNFY